VIVPEPPPLATFKLTDIELCAPPPAIVMAPWYVCASNAAEFTTAKVKLAGVVPFEGMTESQGTVGAAVKLVGELLVN
jgi:hypothetical protein